MLQKDQSLLLPFCAISRSTIPELNLGSCNTVYEILTGSPPLNCLDIVLTSGTKWEDSTHLENITLLRKKAQFLLNSHDILPPPSPIKVDSSRLKKNDIHQQNKVMPYNCVPLIIQELIYIKASIYLCPLNSGKLWAELPVANA